MKKSNENQKMIAEENALDMKLNDGIEQVIACHKLKEQTKND